MRGDHHIGHSPERAVGWQRLWIGDIEPGSRELAGLQCHDQVLRHYTTAARDIDEICAALYPRDIQRRGDDRKTGERRRSRRRAS